MEFTNRNRPANGRPCYRYVRKTDKVPPLGASEDVSDPMVRVKLFTPDSNWTWYLIEADDSGQCFGLVRGFELELGYFDLNEIAAARGPSFLRMPIERDIHWKPRRLSEVQQAEAR